jgi:protein involved in polysaccharide export with SLBB domain
MDWLKQHLGLTVALLPIVFVVLTGAVQAFGQQGGPLSAPSLTPPRRGSAPGDQQGGPLSQPSGLLGPTLPSPTAPEMPPTVTILEPVDGATVNATTLRVSIAFGGLVSEPRAFRIVIDGSDQTHLFAITPSGASATIGPLPEGRHEITAALSDRLGRGATGLTRFTVDLKSGDLSPIELAFAQAALRTQGRELTPQDFRRQDIRRQDVRRQDVRTQDLRWQDFRSQDFSSQDFSSQDQRSRDLKMLGIDQRDFEQQESRLQTLRQFGYDLFRTVPSTFAPVSDVPVGGDYVLGPGDTLQVYLWGMVDNVLTLPVNQRGEIFLPKVGAFPVRGMPLGEVRRLIQEQLSRQFSGFRMSLSLSELRSLQIYVVGEVARPGVYTVSSLSTLTNTLFAAGGPTKLGSLRNIQLIRNNRTVAALDLYDFLLRGDRTRDLRVESGDTVFVPPIGSVVAITGNIKRPAIYELKGATRIRDLLEHMAGGITPTGYLQRVQVERVKAHEEKVVLDFNLSAFYRDRDPKANFLLEEGDLVRIFPIDPKVYNTVTLEGFVRRPGEYEFKAGMRLSEFMRPVEMLPEAYLDRVEVIRTKPDFTREVLAANLRKLWQGDQSQDITLNAKDRIVVASETRPSGAVSLRGEVKRPGIYPIVQGERLSSVLKRAGGFTEDAYLKGALFIREQLRRQQQEELDRFINAQEEALLQEAARGAAGSLELASGGREEVALQQQTVQQRRQLLELLKTKVVLGRMVVKVDELDRFEGSPSDITLEEGDTLTIPKQPSSVLVIGSVRNPTAVVYEAGRDVEYYLNRAGGLNKDADKGELHIVKADGSAMAGFLRLRKIEPGDIIVVPPKVEAKVRTLPAVKDIATILGQFALTAGVIGALF